MDYQQFVNGFELTTCIISVEKFPDGGYGNIRIVAGNKPYIDSIENPYELEIELNTIPGVLENGIFAGITDKVIVGKESGIEVIEK